MNRLADSRLAHARALVRLPAQRKVASLLEGEYAALHLGRSTEFNDLREYVRGDDPKDLDWKASARARTLLVRRYDALRRLQLLLVVSTGRSMAAAGAHPGVAKRDVAVAVAAVLGGLAVRHGDLVGLVSGDGAERRAVPQRSGAAHVERCLEQVWRDTTVDAAPSDLGALLREVVRTTRSRRMVVVVADEPRPTPGVLDPLRRLRAQHEVLVVGVDGLIATDVAPDAPGPVRDVGLSTGVPRWLRTDADLMRDAAEARRAERARLDAELDRLRIAHCRVGDVPQTVGALRELFERHRRVGHR